MPNRSRASSHNVASFPDSPKEKDILQRREDIELALVGATEDVRFRVAKAVRSLLSRASNSALSKSDLAPGPVSIKLLADVLRNAATLVDSIHDLSKAEVLLSADVGSVVSDVADMVEACRDFSALRHVSSGVIKKLADSMDAAAQTVEKSEEVLDLVGQLSSIELGVNNLGISREEFAILSGTKPAPLDPNRPTGDAVLSTLGVKPEELARVKQMARDMDPPVVTPTSPTYTEKRLTETAPYVKPIEVKLSPYDMTNEARAKQLAESEAAIQALDAKRLGNAAYRAETEMSSTGVFKEYAPLVTDAAGKEVSLDEAKPGDVVYFNEEADGGFSPE